MFLKGYSKNITSYDLFKAAALMLMLVDHIGSYFYTDVDFLRVVGRLCVPIWFFLIGYARNRDLSLGIISGAFILLVANYVVGMPLYSLNILFTIMITRIFLRGVDKYSPSLQTSVFAIVPVLCVLALPTLFLFEYGVHACVLALLGYYCRLKHDSKLTAKDDVSNFQILFLMAFLSYGAYQQLIFGFSLANLIFLFVGSFAVFVILLQFKPMELPHLTNRIPVFFVAIIRLCGRYTLEAYVLHLLVFKFVAIYIGMDDLEWFNLEYFTQGF